MSYNQAKTDFDETLERDHPQALKPCPFCGGDDSVIRRVRNSNDAMEHFVLCRVCYAHGTHEITDEEAAERWNTRVVDSELERLNQALQEVTLYTGEMLDVPGCPKYCDWYQEWKKK